MAPMHAGEVGVDASLVHGLLRDQFPAWAEQPLTIVDPEAFAVELGRAVRALQTAPTVLRSRGAAIQQACAALPYYLDTYPLIVERSRHKLTALGVAVRAPA